MVRFEQDPSSWLCRALCRRYRLGIFDAARVPLHGARAGQEVVVHWEMAWLLDGNLEMLGAWMRRGGRLQTLIRMIADLDRLGVEYVWLMVARWRDAYLPTALVASPPWPTLEQVEVIEQRAAGEVRGQVARHLALDEAFESESAVLHRAAMAFQRAERQRDRDRQAAVGHGGQVSTRGELVRRPPSRAAH